MYKQFGGPFISSPFAFHSVINLISWVQSVICQTAVCPAGYRINLNSLEPSKFSVNTRCYYQLSICTNPIFAHEPRLGESGELNSFRSRGQGPWRRLWLLVGNRLSHLFSFKMKRSRWFDPYAKVGQTSGSVRCEMLMAFYYLHSSVGPAASLLLQCFLSVCVPSNTVRWLDKDAICSLLVG